MEGAKFEIGQKVKVKLWATEEARREKTGEVGAQFKDRHGFQYRVDYVNDRGEIVDRYFKDEEIEAA